jgi:hypothetical protein
MVKKHIYEAICLAVPNRESGWLLLMERSSSNLAGQACFFLVLQRLTQTPLNSRQAHHINNSYSCVKKLLVLSYPLIHIRSKLILLIPCYKKMRIHNINFLKLSHKHFRFLKFIVLKQGSF